MASACVDGCLRERRPGLSQSTAATIPVGAAATHRCQGAPASGAWAHVLEEPQGVFGAVPVAALLPVLAVVVIRKACASVHSHGAAAAGRLRLHLAPVAAAGGVADMVVRGGTLAGNAWARLPHLHSKPYSSSSRRRRSVRDRVTGK